MKKINITLIIFMMLFFANESSGKEFTNFKYQLNSSEKDKYSKVKIGGLRFGWHRAAIYNDGKKLTNTSSLDNFYIGVYKDLKIIPMLYFGTGFEYFKNGMEMKGGSELKLNYLSVPLNVKLKVGPGFMRIGSAPSFKIYEKFNRGDSQDVRPEKSNTFDYPFFVGGGFKFLMLSIEVRYHWGAREINNMGDKNRYFQLGAGISF